MPKAGDVLFSGSRFIFWSLAPFLVIFCLVMPLTIDRQNTVGFVLIIALEIAAVLLLIGLLNPRRFNWALRLLSLMVFAAYAAYLIDEVFIEHSPFRLFQSQGVASSRNAVLGLIFIGLPCLGYALHGTFSSETKIEAPDLENHPD